jgi:uncharacterized membrane protein
MKVLQDRSILSFENAKTGNFLNLFLILTEEPNNITNVSPINDKWSQTFLLHGNGTFGNTDMNHDGFLTDRKEHRSMQPIY